MKPKEAADELRFVASVSHELRGPLHAILGLSEILAEAELDTDHRRMAQAISTEAHALRVMIDDILDLSRISSGQVELETESFSPAQVISQLVENVRADADAKSLTLLFDVENTVAPHVTGDRTRFGQVVRNLVSNAIRYTDKGSIWVSLRSEGNDTLVCSVRDTGIGIAGAKLERLFEPFVQVHTGRSGGAGLGLAVSKRLAEHMGGSITVASVLGQGSVFEFSLSMNESAPAQAPEQGRPTEACFGRVLVVEDSIVNQMLAKTQLDRLGYEHEIVPDAEKALLLLVDETFDAVLMDWNLPGMDGLAATRMLREQNLAPDTAIIAMTANALSGDRERCIEAGMDDFLAKPVSLDDLRLILERWITTPDADQAETPGDEVVESSLTRLTDELGGVATVASLARTFLDELPGRIDAIVAGTTSADAINDAKRAAHTLKSTAALLGADHLAALCAQVSDADEAPEQSLVPEIQRESMAVDQALRRFITMAEETV